MRDRFEIRNLKLEDVNGEVAVMSVHAAAQMRWTSASAPKRQPGTRLFMAFFMTFHRFFSDFSWISASSRSF